MSDWFLAISAVFLIFLIFYGMFKFLDWVTTTALRQVNEYEQEKERS